MSRFIRLPGHYRPSIYAPSICISLSDGEDPYQLQSGDVTVRAVDYLSEYGWPVPELNFGMPCKNCSADQTWEHVEFCHLPQRSLWESYLLITGYCPECGKQNIFWDIHGVIDDFFDLFKENGFYLNAMTPKKKEGTSDIGEMPPTPVANRFRPICFTATPISDPVSRAKEKKPTFVRPIARRLSY